MHRDLKAANLLIDEYEVSLLIFSSALLLVSVQSKITKLALQEWKWHKCTKPILFSVYIRFFSASVAHLPIWAKNMLASKISNKRFRQRYVKMK